MKYTRNGQPLCYQQQKYAKRSDKKLFLPQDTMIHIETSTSDVDSKHYFIGKSGSLHFRRHPLEINVIQGTNTAPLLLK